MNALRILFALSIGFTGPPQGASSPEPGAERRAALEEARELLSRGEYERAEGAFAALLETNAGDPAALVGRGEARLAVGRHEEAAGDLGRAAEIDPSPATLARLGESLAAGDLLEEAEARFREAARDPAEGLARVALADLLRERGRREEAVALLREVTRFAARSLVTEPRALFALGLAYERLGRFEDAAEVFVEALEKDRGLLDAYAALGDLYFRVYRDAEGRANPVEEYKQALRRNPRHVGALLGMFRVYRSNFRRDPAKTEGFLEAALETNPRAVEALLEKTALLVNDRRFREGREAVERALAVRPRSRRARVERASLDFLENRLEAWRQEERALLAEDPSFGGLHGALGSHLVELYRFADAAAILERSVALDPNDPETLTQLGRALANAGREEEAGRALREAEGRERGFVHPWRRNLLGVLDRLARQYLPVESPPFSLRLHPDEREVLEAYLPGLLQEGLETLGFRYGWRPDGPVLVEVFREIDDFSVRTIGFTGFGALGACFGPVVTAVSPLAREARGRFSWEATVWHEFVHVLSLGASRARVPRWLTEGLSTYEERRRSASFDRGMDLELLAARANGEIFPIERLNAAFRGPRILFGYYQAGLVCEFVARERSFEALVRMLRAYGEDRPEGEILREATGMSPEAFDRAFLAFVDERLREVRAEPIRDESGIRALRERVRSDPSDLDAAVSLAWEQSRRGNRVDAEEGVRRVLTSESEHGRANLLAGELALARGRPDVARSHFERGFAAGAEEFFARLNYAAILEKAEEFEAAIEAYRAAKAAFPRCADPDHSPHLALHRLFQGEGRAEEAFAELEAFARLNGRALGPRLDLAAYGEGKADFEAASRWYAEANGIDPFRRELHARWGRALGALERFDEAVREFRVARAVRPDLDAGRGEPASEADDAHERADLFREEAEVHLRKGDRAAASEAARRALELDPGNRRAAEILEETRV